MKKEYDILSGYTADELIDVVTSFLSDDWELQGGVSVTPFPDIVDGELKTRLIYHQAIFRNTKDKKPSKAVGF